MKATLIVRTHMATDQVRRIPLRFVKRGDIITGESGARYRIEATLQIGAKTYAVYQHIKRPNLVVVRSIGHMIRTGYWVETNAETLEKEQERLTKEYSK